jgi:hypothetical protein
VGRVRQPQPQPPPLPADATPIAPAAGLVDGADGGAVFVFGQATSAFATEDEAVAGWPRCSWWPPVSPPRRRSRPVRDRADHAVAVEGRPRRQVRPDARLLDEERKLLTDAIAVAAHNAESTLARILRPHYFPGRQRSPRPAPGGVHPLRPPAHHRGHPHARLDPATVPAAAARCTPFASSSPRPEPATPTPT